MPITNDQECIVFQDAVGDYHYYWEFSQGSLFAFAKFRAPRGTSPEDFVKNYFKGTLVGKDLDEEAIMDDMPDKFDRAHEEQRELVELRNRSLCACRTTNRLDPEHTSIAV
jgi:hypothetical protein